MKIVPVHTLQELCGRSHLEEAVSWGLDYVEMPLVSELFVHRVKIQLGAGVSGQSPGIKIYGIFNSKLHETQCDGENLIKICGIREAQGNIFYHCNP